MVLDLISAAAGAGSVSGGVLIGLAVNGGVLIGLAVNGLRRSTPPLPSPLCSCKHNPGSHDPETGRCLAEIKRPRQWRTDNGRPVSFEWVQCPCRANDGPEPLSVITGRMGRYLPPGEPV